MVRSLTTNTLYPRVGRALAFSYTFTVGATDCKTQQGAKAEKSGLGKSSGAWYNKCLRLILAVSHMFPMLYILCKASYVLVRAFVVSLNYRSVMIPRILLRLRHKRQPGGGGALNPGCLIQGGNIEG